MTDEARYVKQSDIRVEAKYHTSFVSAETVLAYWTATIDDSTYAHPFPKAINRREWIAVSASGASRQDALKNLTDTLRENGVEIVRDA